MNFPIILDVAIGIVVIYFITSLIMSFIMEYIIVRRNWRGEFLYDRLKEMFYSSQGGYYNLIEKVYRHPLVTKVQQYSYRKPENIQSHTFANAFMHVMTEIGKETELLENQSNIAEGKKAKPIGMSQNEYVDKAFQNDKYLDGDGKRIIESLFLQPPPADAKNDDENALTWRINNIEQWYADFQLRLDYLFKREVKWYIFIFSLLLCSLLNIDTLDIYYKLTHSAKLRDQMVLLGEEYASKTYIEIKTEKDSILKNMLNSIKYKMTYQLKTVRPGDTLLFNKILEETLNKTVESIDQSKVDLYKGATDLIGWTEVERTNVKNAINNFNSGFLYWLLKIIGILLSSFALMFGAPFWHEYLKSMLAIRKVIQPKGVVK